MNAKKILSLLLALVMILSMAACGAKEEAPAAEAAPAETTAPEVVSFEDQPEEKEGGVVRGGTLVVAKSWEMAFNSFDIYHSNSTENDAMVIGQICENLINIDSKGNYVPGLAESWEFGEDGLSLTLKLREDVTFSNGTKFNAEAVAKLFNHIITEEFAHTYRSSDLALFGETVALDEYTVQINTTAPDAGLLTELAGTSCYIYAPENVDNGDFGTNPIGTGPFVLVEYAEGDHITIKARSDYYKMGEDGKPLPYLDEIIYRILPDDAARVANLQAGDVDGIDTMSTANSTLTMMGMEGYTTYQLNNNVNFWAGFNFADEDLAKLEVRKAISMAIDRQEIVDVVFEGLGTASPFYSRVDQNWYSDYAPYHEYDPEQAKQLLADAGYPDGISVEIRCISREPDNTILQLMQSQMKAAGIDLVLNPMERTAWVAAVKTDLDYAMCLGQNGNKGLDVSRQIKDPFVTYQTLDIPEAVESQNMYSALKTITDVDARAQAVFDLQKHYHDNVIKLNVCQSYCYANFADYVKNVTLTSFGALDFSQTFLAK